MPEQSAPTLCDVDFVKLSPTQNMTLLVRSEHPVEAYPDIATALMSAGHVHAEQVGFIRAATSPGAHAHLHMAAGEFCGNACMALAVLSAAQQCHDESECIEIVLETTGAADAVCCEVERRAVDYRCRLRMPLPRRVEPYVATGFADRPATRVVYDDAVHIVVEAEPIDADAHARAEVLAAALLPNLEAPLLAVLVWSPTARELAPLISVPALDSQIWERSCGSGTASVGVHGARSTRKPFSSTVIQPGGAMHVEAAYDGERLTELHIAGTVSIIAEGKAYVCV